MGDLGLIPGLGRYPGEGKGYPLQYSGLENSMDCIDKDKTEQVSLSLSIVNMRPKLTFGHLGLSLFEKWAYVCGGADTMPKTPHYCGVIEDFPGGSDGKASAYIAGDPDSIPGSGRAPGEGNGNPLQYSCLENPMDGGIW